LITAFAKVVLDLDVAIVNRFDYRSGVKGRTQLSFEQVEK